jgi:uncharacterized protein (DUF2252 family)
MPVDLSSPQGFNRFWADVVDQFRREAIDDHLQDGNLTPVQDHVVGPTTEEELAAQNAYPFVWSLAQSHTPNYATVSEDHGDLEIQVFLFAQDTNTKAAFDKARALLGRVVNNVEGSALVDDSGTAHASKVLLDSFQMDIGVSPGTNRAQVRSGQATFSVDVERRY